MSSIKLLCSRRHWLPLLLGASAIVAATPACAAPPSDLLPDYASLIADAGDCADDYSDAAAASLVDVETPVAVAAPRQEAPVLLAALDKSTRTTAASTAAPAPAAARTAAVPAPAPVAAPADVAKAVAPAAAPILIWDIRSSDHTLNVAMARWAATAGWQLLWEVPVDYAVEADTSIPGTFEHAVEAVTRSMETAEIPLKAIFYKGNSVIRIVAKGAE